MFTNSIMNIRDYFLVGTTISRRISFLACFARTLVASLCFATTLLGVNNASAAMITYEATAVSENRWIYQYTVTAEASDPVIEEFTVFFDPARYANLLLVSSPPGWDSMVIEPDLGLPADGFFDALALTVGLAPGGSLGGFSVAFDFVGNGRPGEQAFDIVDPVTFATISSGLTRMEGATDLPEPGTEWLMVTPLLFLLRLHARCRVGRSQSRIAN